MQLTVKDLLTGKYLDLHSAVRIRSNYSIKDLMSVIRSMLAYRNYQADEHDVLAAVIIAVCELRLEDNKEQ